MTWPYVAVPYAFVSFVWLFVTIAFVNAGVIDWTERD